MDFRRLGNSGLVVSVVGLGTNNLGMKLDLEQSREVVHAALDEGITLFDTADSYGASEERLGELLEGRRDDIVLATKFGSDAAARGNGNGKDWGARGARRYVIKAVEASFFLRVARNVRSRSDNAGTRRWLGNFVNDDP